MAFSERTRKSEEAEEVLVERDVDLKRKVVRACERAVTCLMKTERACPARSVLMTKMQLDVEMGAWEDNVETLGKVSLGCNADILFPTAVALGKATIAVEVADIASGRGIDSFDTVEGGVGMVGEVCMAYCALVVHLGVESLAAPEVTLAGESSWPAPPSRDDARLGTRIFPRSMQVVLLGAEESSFRVFVCLYWGTVVQLSLDV